MNVLDFIKSMPVLKPACTPIEQTVKTYRYGWFSTPFLAFQSDILPQSWNGWCIQSMQMMIGLWGWPELVVVYQREIGRAVLAS